MSFFRREPAASKGGSAEGLPSPHAGGISSTPSRSRRGRRGRGLENQRRDPSTHREIIGGLALGARPSSELLRLWRVLLWSALALILFQVQAGLLVHGGPKVVRLDLAMIFVTFFAIRLGAVEGALAAFAVGYVADLFVQGPPGLCRFLAVAIWTAGRIAAPRAGLSSAVGRVVYTLGASAIYQLGVLGGLQLVAEAGGGPGRIAWLAVLPQAIFTAALALPIQGMLQQLEKRTSERKA